MGIASQTVTPAQAAQATVAARVQSNGRLLAAITASQTASYAEFWADPLNMAAAFGADLQAAFQVFAALNQALLQTWLHDKLVVTPGVNGAAATRSLAAPVNIPGIQLIPAAAGQPVPDPTLLSSYQPCYPAAWTINWNTDGSGVPAK
jgi:hypothetical protein